MVHARAAILIEEARPRPYAQSRPVVIEEIELDAPGAGEAIVRIASVGLCHSDLSTVDGTFKRSLPLVLGHEAAGVVEAIGSGVTTVKPGDKVVLSFIPSCGYCEWCSVGRPALCVPGRQSAFGGTLLSGERRLRRGGEVISHFLGVSGFAERTVCSVGSLVVVPDDTPLEIAALFGCAALTGIGAVLNTARVEPGASVAIFGAGGVGMMALLGARVAGASTIIVVDPIASKREFALELGATAVVDPLLGDPVEAVRQIAPTGVQYAFETAGNTTAFEGAFDSTGVGGVTVAVGLPRANATAAIPHSLAVREEKTIHGSFMGSAVPRRDIPRYLALWRSGRLPVDKLVTSTFALDDINEAFDALADGKVIRSVCTL